MKEKDISISFLQECFSLDQKSGVLSWNYRPIHHHKDEHYHKIWNSRFLGKRAGWVGKNGYCYVTIDNRHFLAHRIVWALTKGEWPQGVIDHVDGNPLNNRPENLRDVEFPVNMKNLPTPKNNKSGVCGVQWHEKSGKWMARIRCDGVVHYLGIYPTIEEAACVRKEAEVKFGFHANHGRLTPGN
ncbi:HNH endonuclease [Enterobacter kobei]|uniref:HNH endonuclease n=1 Tax=Enterobacter kobei TaxID=208224 RepID=UPI002003DD36|nr:HNH endonuclease [Enterobacter kobei]MCK6814403.1 HNH endonuclease [Enterobacter kobei]